MRHEEGKEQPPESIDVPRAGPSPTSPNPGSHRVLESWQMSFPASCSLGGEGGANLSSLKGSVTVTELHGCCPVARPRRPCRRPSSLVCPPIPSSSPKPTRGARRPPLGKVLMKSGAPNTPSSIRSGAPSTVTGGLAVTPETRRGREAAPDLCHSRGFGIPWAPRTAVCTACMSH